MQEEIVAKRMQSAEKNKEVATDMYSLGHYSWALFMWHLALEKILKAIITKKNFEVPYVHDLWKLSKVAEITYESIGFGQKELDEITTFNLEARYEDYKFEFYKKATKEYADKWISICDSIYQYLEKEIK